MTYHWFQVMLGNVFGALHRFIYLAHSGGGELNAFRRNEDNTLSLVQVSFLRVADLIS